MNKAWAATAAISGTLGLNSPALGNVCANVSISPATPSIPQWDPIAQSSVEANFTLSVTRIANSSKSVRLIFVDTNNTSGTPRIGSSGPQYQIVNTISNAVISLPSGTQVTGSTVPITQFGNGANDTVNIPMKIRIPAATAADDFIGGTSFAEMLRYSLQCFKSNDKDNGVDNAVTSNLTLGLTIPKIVSIVTAQPAPIDFGAFTTTSQQALITVKSTSTLNVAVATANGSQLVRSGSVSPYPVNASIPYTMAFNGAQLSSGTPLVNQTRAGVVGSSYPLKLTLTGGIPSGKLAGSYSDTITLTITAGQ